MVFRGFVRGFFVCLLLWGLCVCVWVFFIKNTVYDYLVSRQQMLYYMIDVERIDLNGGGLGGGGNTSVSWD